MKRLAIAALHLMYRVFVGRKYEPMSESMPPPPLFKDRQEAIALLESSLEFMPKENVARAMQIIEWLQEGVTTNVPVKEDSKDA